MDFEAIISAECPTPIRWITERRHYVNRVNDEIRNRDTRITALEEAVAVLAAAADMEMCSNPSKCEVCRKIQDAVNNNPIAAEAVRKAGG